MKNKKIAIYIVFSAMGAALCAAGLLIKLAPDAQGILLTLPNVCVGVGAGVFGGSLSTAITNYRIRKNPQKAKQIEIEEKDERNRAVSCRAKAKAYDVMRFVLGAVVLTFALMEVEMYVVLTLVAVYLLLVGVNTYCLVKYQKEM